MSADEPDSKKVRRDVNKREANVSERILAAPLVSALRPEWFTSEAIDPQVASINDRIVYDSAQSPELPEVGVEATRAAKAKAFVHGKNFEDLLLPGLDGKQTVGARLFRPKSHVVQAALLHIHGGGFISGSAYGQNDTRLEVLCESCGLAVLSVDYRLAPEHTFPAASDDCLAAARWLATEGRAQLNCDILLLLGESSGGNLAASLLLRLRDDGDHASKTFVAACLVFGVYDASLTPSARNWGERRLICNTRELEWWVRTYVGDYKNLHDPMLSPLHGHLQRLPPALFVVGTEDALLDDSLFMHARWAAAGNDSTLALFPGAPHGVGHFGPHKDTEQGIEVRATIQAFLRKHIHQSRHLLKNDVCTLRAIIPETTLPTQVPNATGYWLVASRDGQLSAFARSGEATMPTNDARELMQLEVFDPPLQCPNTTPQRSEPLPGDGVNIGTRLLISDSRVNIWEFRLRPGASCAYHRHRLPYFFTNLTASSTQALTEDGSPGDCAAVFQRQGQTTFVGLDGVSAHGVKNVGESDFLQFVVEFKLWGQQ